MQRNRPWGRLLVASLAVVAITIVSACGSDDDDAATAGDGAPTDEPVQVTAIVDDTGVAGFAGRPEGQGIELGVAQLNDQGYNIELEVEDTGSDQTQAVNLMNQAARSDADVVMYGPLSSIGQALAPIAQREEVPLIAMQSGVTGVVEAGEYVFRVTTPQRLFFPSLFEYLEEEGVERISVFYADDIATVVELAEDVMPPLLDEHGMEEVSRDTVTSDQTNFASIASNVVAAKPDAVFAGTQGTQNVTVVNQLRRAGYDGIIFSAGGFAGGVLDPLEKNAHAIVYPVWYAAETDLKVGRQFARDYEAEYGSPPSTFAGEAYDATLLLKAALDHIDGEVTRESLQEALVEATEAGFDGAQGEPLAFEERDARGGGFILRRDDGVDQVVKSPDAE